MGVVDNLKAINDELTGSGSLSALNGEVKLTLTGHANTTFQLTGTWVGTVTFEASNDNSTWVDIFSYRAGDSVIAQTTTTNGIFRCTTAGLKYVRARVSAYTSGTVVVTAYASNSTSGVFINFPLPRIPHIGMVGDPYTLIHKTAQYTTTQTGAALWTPAAGKKLVITQVHIQAGGTTAGNFQLWFGASADTTYTRGTDQAIFDGEFAPSNTNKPGVTMTGLWIASTADHILRVTDSAAINPLTVTVWGYEI